MGHGVCTSCVSFVDLVLVMQQTFKLDGQVMIDPLSLADFSSVAEARSATIQVEIEGYGEASAKASSEGKVADEEGKE